MLVSLDTKFIGPAEEFHLEFGKRLTILTGDNGLGKSLLLDLAFFACAEEWPERVVVPRREKMKSAKLNFSFTVETRGYSIDRFFTYDPIRNIWLREGAKGSLYDFGSYEEMQLVESILIYERIKGEYSVSDYFKGLARGAEDHGIFPFVDHYSFDDVWYGKRKDLIVISEGIYKDWEDWKYKYKDRFEQFCNILRNLSAPNEEMMDAGNAIRLPGLDSRDWPVIKTISGDIPIIHASESVKRILSLAYMVVRNCWEHKRALEAAGEVGSRHMIVIIDEIETHLHPRWQRVILPALLSLAEVIDDFDIQFIVSTHSPLVLAGIESDFDPERDKLYHLEQAQGQVRLEELPFEKYGDISDWLTSEVFGLAQARSLQAEKAIMQARELMRGNRRLSPAEQKEIEGLLRTALPSSDPFWTRWEIFKDSGDVE